MDIFESSEIGLVRFMIDSFYSANFKEICPSQPESTIEFLKRIASEGNPQRSSNDIELRKEIIAAMISNASDKDFIKRVDSIYNWIKEGKL